MEAQEFLDKLKALLVNYKFNDEIKRFNFISIWGCI